MMTLVASLLSGLVGVIVSFFAYKGLEQKRIKMETARKLFGGKHNLSSKEFQEAMNEVLLVFSDSDPVIAAIDELWTTLDTPRSTRSPKAADDKLIRLMKAICSDIGIKYKDLPDDYFLRCFVVPEQR